MNMHVIVCLKCGHKMWLTPDEDLNQVCVYEDCKGQTQQLGLVDTKKPFNLSSVSSVSSP